MTRAEALREARRRWGARATVIELKRGEPRCGVYAPGTDLAGRLGVLTTMGTGPTWSAAFADADARERAS